MLSMKVSGVFTVLGSIILLMGFLVDGNASYLMDGNTIRMFSYALLVVVCFFLAMASDDANRRQMSKELRVFDVATYVVQLVGPCLSLAGEFSIDVMGTRAFVWVGVVGSSLTAISGVMILLKELWIEHLEEEN